MALHVQDLRVLIAVLTHRHAKLQMLVLVAARQLLIVEYGLLEVGLLLLLFRFELLLVHMATVLGLPELAVESFHLHLQVFDAFFPDSLVDISLAEKIKLILHLFIFGPKILKFILGDNIFG
jgi:hypothetical protein